MGCFVQWPLDNDNDGITLNDLANSDVKGTSMKKLWKKCFLLFKLFIAFSSFVVSGESLIKREKEEQFKSLKRKEKTR